MKKINFNKDWLFTLDGCDSVKVDIPHDFSIGRERREDALSGGAGGFFQGGYGVYEKTFTAKKNKKYFFMCDGSFGITEIRVNNNLVYINKYGYNTFVADLTDYLRYNEENALAVRVNNKWQPNARWYTGSGMYRDAFLCVSDSSYLNPYGPFVYTESIIDGTAYMGTEISYYAEKKGEGVVEFEIFEDGKRAPVCSFVRHIYAEKGENTYVTRFQIENAKLWDTEAPDMYSVKVTLKLGNAVDTDYSVFGVRTIVADSKKGLLLNGKSIKLLGGCIHHDHGPIGACAYAESEYRRIVKMKQAGFNAVRLSHNPQSQHLYDACDRLGMLVIDELFDYWTDGKQKDDMHVFFDDNYLKWTKEIVLRNRCHPSIIMWSTGNEIPQKSGRGYGYSIAKSIADKIRSLDTSRPLIHCFCGLWDDKEEFEREKAELDFSADVMDYYAKKIAITADTVDIIGYNYMESRLERDLVRFPDKLFVNTETFPLSAFTTYAQLKDNPRILGDFVWTAWDYFGETGIGHINYHYPEPTDLLADRFPNHISNCGDFEITGIRKPQSYYRQIAWEQGAPIIAVTPPDRNIRPYSPSAWGFYDCEFSWKFDGYEGQMAKVYVFADCDEAVLYVNEKEIGRQERNEKGIYIFDAAYEPGEISAVIYKDGKKTGHSSLYTEGDIHHLSVKQERKYLSGRAKKTNEDIVYVNIEAKDKAGMHCTNDERAVELYAEGAEIIGVANGDLLTNTVYTSTTHRLHRGTLLAVLKKTDKNSRLTVKAEGLPDVEIDIR